MKNFHAEFPWRIADRVLSVSLCDSGVKGKREVCVGFGSVSLHVFKWCVWLETL